MLSNFQRINKKGFNVNGKPYYINLIFYYFLTGVAAKNNTATINANFLILI